MAAKSAGAHAGKHGSRIVAFAPKPSSTPIVRITVVTEVAGFVLPRYRLVRVDSGTVSDSILGNRDGEYFSHTIRLAERVGRNQHFAAELCVCIDDSVADDPRFVVEIEILDLPNRSVGGTDREPLRALHALRSVVRSP
jgi:hypothetical protein